MKSKPVYNVLVFFYRRNKEKEGEFHAYLSGLIVLYIPVLLTIFIILGWCDYRPTFLENENSFITKLLLLPFLFAIIGIIALLFPLKKVRYYAQTLSARSAQIGGIAILVINIIVLIAFIISTI